MARWSPATPPNWFSFPRPRGDGPVGAPGVHEVQQFSPPTRGWPVCGQNGCGCERVFPAHAGMARRMGSAPLSVMGFPRPRGDGPTVELLPVALFPFSPPTRGWPVKEALFARAYEVFPAHAGMARGISRPNPPPPCFPRPRGDGPARVHVYSQACEFSPPTRGWPGH